MCSQIDDHAARFHRSHHFFGNQLRCRFARDQRRGDDNVNLRRLSSEQRHLCFDKGFGHHFGVAVAAARFFLEIQLEEFRAHALHLLFDFRASVEGANNGSQAAGSTDGRQPGDAGTDDHHLGRWNLARSGDLTGKETAKLMRGFNNCPVAGDIRHRTQRVHRLCA
ncbi:hypothetical protein D3C79_753770 [compost metagenome]